MDHFVVFLAVFFSCAVIIKCCDVDYYAVGCYKDDLHNRALSFQLINERDETSNVFNGHKIDWSHWNHYMRELACRCAEAARSKGYTVFGLQFYGECWAGPDENSYSNVGVASWDQCVTDEYEDCTPTCSHCVGKSHINYVYKLGKTDVYYPGK